MSSVSVRCENCSSMGESDMFADTPYGYFCSINCQKEFADKNNLEMKK